MDALDEIRHDIQFLIEEHRERLTDGPGQDPDLAEWLSDAALWASVGGAGAAAYSLGMAKLLAAGKPARIAVLRDLIADEWEQTRAYAKVLRKDPRLKVPHGITWEQLRECPASDLQDGDTFVQPGIGSAYWTLLSGNVQGAGLAELDGTAWAVLRRDGDRIRARSHEGREATFRIRADREALRVVCTQAQVEARRTLLDKALRVHRSRAGTGRPGDGWQLVEANCTFEVLYRGAQHTAVLGASDDGTRYEVRVYSLDKVKIHSDSFDDLDAAFRCGATGGAEARLW